MKAIGHPLRVYFRVPRDRWPVPSQQGHLPVPLQFRQIRSEEFSCVLMPVPKQCEHLPLPRFSHSRQRRPEGGTALSYTNPTPNSGRHSTLVSRTKSRTNHPKPEALNQRQTNCCHLPSPSAHSGIFPCFFAGFLSRLPSSISNAWMIFLRVSRGRITPSM